MIRIKYAVFCLLIVTKAVAQTSEFGKVTLDEIKYKQVPFDTTAGAVILFDKGECTLNEDFQLSYKRHTRIKFITKAAIDDWASRTIYVDKHDETLAKLKGVTYNLENGAIMQSEMEEKSVFRGKFDRTTDEVKFTLPNVKEGSVIEYTYTLRSRASLLPDWAFQHTLPCLYSEFKTFIPRTFTFRTETKGFLPVTEHTSQNDGAQERWAMKNVPAFKEEPFTSNYDDYVSTMELHLTELFVPGSPIVKFTTTWPKIANDLQSNPDFGMLIKGSGYLKSTVAEVTAGKTTDEEKLSAIYDYVKSNVEWSGMIDKLPDHPFKKVLEMKKGSTSEINLLLVTMFQKAGLKSFPVLLSTRKHGRINPFYPSFRQFNDVICVVKMGEKNILLDATDRGLPMTALPERCLNGEGFIVSLEEMGWIPLVSIRSRKVVNADYKVSETGEVTGKLVIKRDGLAASGMRESYKDLGHEKYIKNFLAGRSWELSNSTFDNLENASMSPSETHEMQINDHTQTTGDIIYLNPYVLDRMEENIFKSEQRQYPVDFSTPIDRIYMAKIQIPEGFQVEELPKQKLIMLPANGGKFIYSASQMGNTINFVSQFIINRSVFAAEEYASLREFYNQVVAKQAEQIVLKKKS